MKKNMEEISVTNNKKCSGHKADCCSRCWTVVMHRKSTICLLWSLSSTCIIYK